MGILGENDALLPDGERGEIVIRGHNIMKGYWKRPDANKETLRNGWFHSGDIGYRDADGCYFIVDRKKDMILRGGFNVYPREVEEVLYAHPCVAEAAVIGIVHESHGEEVKAVIALKAGAKRQRRRDHRLLQGTPRGLQVPARRRVHRGAAEGADREDPEARTALAAGPIDVSEIAPRRHAIAHQPLQLRRFRKAPGVLARPHEFVADAHLEDAAAARRERHAGEFRLEGGEQFLRQPRGAQQPAALGAVGDGDGRGAAASQERIAISATPKRVEDRRVAAFQLMRERVVVQQAGNRAAPASARRGGASRSANPAGCRR